MTLSIARASDAGAVTATPASSVPTCLPGPSTVGPMVVTTRPASIGTGKGRPGMARRDTADPFYKSIVGLLGSQTQTQSATAGTGTTAQATAPAVDPAYANIASMLSSQKGQATTGTGTTAQGTAPAVDPAYANIASLLSSQKGQAMTGTGTAGQASTATVDPAYSAILGPLTSLGAQASANATRDKTSGATHQASPLYLFKAVDHVLNGALGTTLNKTVGAAARMAGRLLA